MADVFTQQKRSEIMSRIKGRGNGDRAAQNRGFCGLELKAAADEVREHWDEWLKLVTQAERWAERHQDDPFLCFAVAWLSLEPRRYRVALGDMTEITKALAGQTIAPCFISMSFLLRCLRGNAKLAGIRLPPRLTIDQDEPGYEDWHREIRVYQQYADARLIKARKRLQKA